MRIALRNIIKHRWTSALMFVIFVLISAALYWTTGIANAVQKIEYHMYRDSDGDATLYLWGNWWGFYEGGKILKALGGLKMENVVLERSAWGSYVDNDRTSAQGNVFELTPKTGQGPRTGIISQWRGCPKNGQGRGAGSEVPGIH